MQMIQDLLDEIGPFYGYFPNGAKTHILVESQHSDKTKETIKDTAMMTSEEGKRYLGGVMGTASFIQQFVQRKVEAWVMEVEKLSKFAVTQAHASYAAFTHGLLSRWNYFLQVVNWEIISPNELLQPLE